MIFLGARATFGLLILGIPSALPFGIIASLFEIIPYFGSIIGTFLPALVALSISPSKLFGFIGILLALTVAAVIITLIDEFTLEEPALEQVAIESTTDSKSSD
jgi:predicted PurR-regulated permease PerM